MISSQCNNCDWTNPEELPLSHAYDKKETVLNTNQSHTPDEYRRLNKVYLYKYPAACTRLSTHT